MQRVYGKIGLTAVRPVRFTLNSLPNPYSFTGLPKVGNWYAFVNHY